MPKMAEDPLRTVIDAIRNRLHEELEAQLALLSGRQQEELEATRRAAEAEAEQRWSTKVEAIRSEWTARLESEVTAARGEAERRMVAESMRLRVEAEQAAAESAARVREELEHALEAERERSSTQLTAEREHLTAQLNQLRSDLGTAGQQFDAVVRERDELVAARDGLTAEVERERRAREADAVRQQQAAAEIENARVSERESQLAIVERLLTAIKAMDAARSLSDVLSALITSAAAEAPRVALFVVEGAELRGWKSEGFSDPAASLHVSVRDAGLFQDVMRRREPVTTDGGSAAPAFASLPSDRAAIAVPLLVGAQPVAVLYADDASEGQAAPASWPEAIQILGRHASVNLAHLTAARAAEAMRRSLAPAGAPATAGAGPSAPQDGNSARRYARLLVSEIKLYNEAAVRLGRQKRDLLARLKPEIERARKLYEQRVSSSVDSRGALFQQELIQTLADGDPSLLGNPA